MIFELRWIHTSENAAGMVSRIQGRKKKQKRKGQVERDERHEARGGGGARVQGPARASRDGPIMMINLIGCLHSDS